MSYSRKALSSARLVGCRETDNPTPARSRQARLQELAPPGFQRIAAGTQAEPEVLARITDLDLPPLRRAPGAPSCAEPHVGGAAFAQMQAGLPPWKAARSPAARSVSAPVCGVQVRVRMNAGCRHVMRSWASSGRLPPATSGRISPAGAEHPAPGTPPGTEAGNARGKARAPRDAGVMIQGTPASHLVRRRLISTHELGEPRVISLRRQDEPLESHPGGVARLEPQPGAAGRVLADGPQAHPLYCQNLLTACERLLKRNSPITKRNSPAAELRAPLVVARPRTGTAPLRRRGSAGRHSTVCVLRYGRARAAAARPSPRPFACPTMPSWRWTCTPP